MVTNIMFFCFFSSVHGKMKMKKPKQRTLAQEEEVNLLFQIILLGDCAILNVHIQIDAFAHILLF